jgi:predicted RNA-binding protein
MCLSRVFEKKGSEETLLLNNIQKISFEGDSVIFTDLLERETKLQGKLITADLVKGKVVIDTGEVRA